MGLLRGWVGGWCGFASYGAVGEGAFGSGSLELMGESILLVVPPIGFVLFGDEVLGFEGGVEHGLSKQSICDIADVRNAILVCRKDRVDWVGERNEGRSTGSFGTSARRCRNDRWRLAWSSSPWQA